jgi:hypothetical protein
MPNWIEGTMKVRGNSENLKNFIENAIEANIGKNEYGTDVEYDIPDSSYIIGSRSAFVREQCYCYIDYSLDKNQTIIIPIRQAWSFTPCEGAEQLWINLAKEYSVDLRLQGFECGAKFYQDFAVVNGEITINEVKHYEDWDWECPMPQLGG